MKEARCDGKLQLEIRGLGSDCDTIQSLPHHATYVLWSYLYSTGCPAPCTLPDNFSHGSFILMLRHRVNVSTIRLLISMPILIVVLIRRDIRRWWWFGPVIV